MESVDAQNETEISSNRHHDILNPMRRFINPVYWHENCTMNSVSILHGELEDATQWPVIVLVIIAIIANALEITTFMRIYRRGQNIA